jgi:hypothetical protein
VFHYLLSYFYYRTTDLDELARSAGRDDLTFFADSGAFSAHTTGQHIELAEYAEWLDRWRHRIHAYASLDVLFDPEGTARNTQELRALGLDPIPVFHLGSPMKALERYLDESPYVAIGGMASGTLTMRDKRLWKYLDLVHGKAAAAGVGLHGFGLSAWPVIRAFPWRSCDSSSPGLGYRYGRIQVYDPYTDRWHAWALRDTQSWHRLGWLVREYGMSPEDFKGSNVAIRSALITISARAWSRAAAMLAGKRLYVTDGVYTRNETSGKKLLGTYEAGNQWDTRVYMTDTANGAMKGGPRHAEQFAEWERGNQEGMRLYLTDPHPSANKNRERIAAWEQGNTWGAQEPPSTAPAPEAPLPG